MSTLSKASKALKYDSRLLKYNLGNGVISQQEWGEHIGSLTDVEAQSKGIEIADSRSKQAPIEEPAAPAAPAQPMGGGDMYSTNTQPAGGGFGGGDQGSGGGFGGGDQGSGGGGFNSNF